METENKGREIPRILIVDDLEINVIILEQIIKKMGYIPLAANEGKGALEIMNYTLPQIILLDVSMPEMSGYELCEILKKIKGLGIFRLSSYPQWMEAMIKSKGLRQVQWILLRNLSNLLKLLCE